MWEYLSTYSKVADTNVSLMILNFIELYFLIIPQTTTGGNKLYYRADFADYMISLGERSAAVGFVSNKNK